MENPDCRFLPKSLFLYSCIFSLSFLFLTPTFARTSPIDDVACDFTMHDRSSFEDDWGALWNDGGSDCYRNYEPAQGGNSSNYCIRLRDNSGANSSMHTNNMNCSSVQEVKVNFMYLPESMEAGEDFLLECSTDGGFTYWTVQQWISGNHFDNGTFYNESVTFSGAFTANTVLRFRCDASSNYDKIYLDEIHIELCTGSTPVATCDGAIAGLQLNPHDGGSLLGLNGQTLCTSDYLISDVSIRANVTGSHESLKYTISTPQGTVTNTENQETYDSHYFRADHPGTYTITAQLYSDNNLGGILCDEMTVSFEVHDCQVDPCAILGGDSDGDGHCDANDCMPHDPSLPTTPGTQCNDGNPQTENDVIGSDGCSCVGTVIAVDPCAGLGGDSDGDGYCDANDCKPHDPAYPATPGTYCNDGNPQTENDVILANGCVCAGTPVSTGGACQYVDYSFDGFESGWGIWNDGGSDCYRNYEVGTAAGGSNYCIRTRDNSGYSSSIISNVIDCSNAQEIMIDFWYMGESMENGEDFYLEFSNNGGNSYTTIQQWFAGQHFSNDTPYNESVTFTETFNNNCKIRFRCDASSNYDKVYFDDIKIKICEGGTVTPPACDPTATVCNTGSCPLQIAEWLPSGDVILGTVTAGNCSTINAYDGMMLRFINTNQDWNNLLFDESATVYGCDDVTYNISAQYYCGNGPVTSDCNLSVDLGADISSCWEQTTITPAVSGLSTCTTNLGCNTVQSQPLVSWSLDACRNYNYAYDYSEFTPYVHPNNGCSSVHGSIVERHNPNTNYHSCVKGVNDQGYGMCISSNTGTWANYNEKTIKFNVTMSPAQAAQLSKLEFYELSPTHIYWESSYYSQDYQGYNNRPLKYGCRVIKNGSVIYQSDNNNTTTAWSLESFDFSNDPDFQITTTTTFQFELVAYSAIGNGSHYSVWDLDNIKIFGGCCTPVTTQNTSYLWSGPDNFSSTDGSISVVESGMYSVTVTDCNGCTAMDKVTINSDVFVINCPTDAAVSCLDSTLPATTGMASSTGDNCGTPVITYTDSANGECGSLIRTWTASAGGKTRDCTQNISVSAIPATIDCNIDPTASSPFNLGCNPSLIGGLPTLAPTSVNGTDCTGAINVTTYEDDLQVNGCDKILTRTFSVFDACSGSNVTCDIVFTWSEDLGMPQLICGPVTGDPFEDFGCNPQTLDGIIPIGLIETASAFDNCAGDQVDVTIYNDDLSADGCDRTLIRTWTYRDDCNNVGTCSFTYLWKVSEEINIECPAEPIAVICEETIPASGQALVTAPCGLNGNVVVEYVPYESLVIVCSGPVGEYVFTATDQCGLSASCTQIVEVSSPEPNIDCPADVTINCLDAYAPGIAIVTDQCGYASDVTIGNLVQQSGAGCSDAVYTVSYTLDNHPCGYAGSCAQTVTLEVIPEGIVCTDEITIVECVEDINIENEIFTTACGEEVLLIAGAPVSTDIGIDCNSGGFEVSLEGTLACGTTIGCTRAFEVINEGPVTSCQQTIISYCDVSSYMPVNTNVTLPCNEDVLSVPAFSQNYIGDCAGGSLEVIYRYSDQCYDLEYLCIVSVLPVAPIIAECPEASPVTLCDDLSDYLPSTLTVTAACGAEVVLAGMTGLLEEDCEGGALTVTYSYADACNDLNIECEVDVEPAPAATISCPVGTLTQCDLTPDLLPVATVNLGCGGSTTIANSGFLLNSDCLLGGIIDLTYTYEQGCNVANTVCELAVLPAQQPEFTCPMVDPVDYCDIGQFQPVFATISLPCGDVPNVQGVNQGFVGDCNGGSFTVTYTYVDACYDLEFPCVVSVVPVANAEFNCPVAAAVNVCDLENYIPASGTAVLGCTGNISVSGVPAEYEDGCEGGTLIVTYTLNSACGGGSFDCEVIIDPAPASEIICPAGPLTQCEIVVDEFPEALVNLSCGGTTSVGSMTVDNLVSCETGGFIDVIYTYNDDECNQLTSVCSIELLPTEAPAITCPEATTVSCQSDLVAGEPIVGLICGAQPALFEVSIPDVNLQNCPGESVEITYTAFSLCANVSSSCTQTVSIDNNGPSINCPVDLTVNCGEDYNLGTPTAVTACALEYDVEFPNFLTDTEEECQPAVVQVEHAIVDDCGRRVTCIQKVTTIFEGPTLVCPIVEPLNFCEFQSDPSTVEADATLLFGCGSVVVISAISSGASAICEVGGTAETTYAYDGCIEFQGVCVVQILPAPVPTISCPTIDPVEFCDIVDFSAPEAIVVESCGEMTSVFGTFNYDNMDCGGGTFDVAYNFGNDCGEASIACAVTVLPAEEATLVCPEIPTVSYCDLADFTAPMAIANACGVEENVVGSFVIAHISCDGGMFEVAYSYMGCGANMITCSVMVEVAPAPMLSCPEIAPVAYCDIFTFTAPLAIATPGCGGTVEVVGGFSIMSVPCDGGTFDVTYEYTECGMVAAVCEVIIEPASAPEFLCPDTQINLNCDESFDDFPSSVPLLEACGGETIVTTFIDETFDTDCFGEREYVRTFSYTDACNNTASCSIVGLKEITQVLGATAFMDEDDSGCFSQGDSGLSGITATLYQATGGCDPVTGFPMGISTAVPGATAVTDNTGFYLIEYCGCVEGPLFVIFSGYDGLEPITSDPDCNSAFDSDSNANGMSSCFMPGVSSDVPFIGLKPASDCSEPCITDPSTVFAQATTTMDNGTAVFSGQTLTMVGSDIDPADNTSILTYNEVCFTAGACDLEIGFDWTTNMPSGFLAGDISLYSIDGVNSRLSQCYVDTDGDGDIDLRDCASDSGSEFFLIPAGSEFCFIQMSDNQFTEATTVFSGIEICNIQDFTEDETENQSSRNIDFGERSILSLAAETIDAESSIAKVYPNPASGMLYLEIETAKAGSLNGAMYSNMGEVIHTFEEVPLEQGSNMKNIDVSDMTAGTYILRLEIGTEVIFTRVTVIK